MDVFRRMQFLSSIDFLALSANIFEYRIFYSVIFYFSDRENFMNTLKIEKTKQEAFEKSDTLLQHIIFNYCIEIIHICISISVLCQFSRVCFIL